MLSYSWQRTEKQQRQNRSERGYTIYSMLSTVFSVICGPNVIFCSTRIDSVSCSLCGLDYYMLLLCGQNEVLQREKKMPGAERCFIEER